MTTLAAGSDIIGKLFARTPNGQERSLPQWELLISDITNLARSANALMCVFGPEGSGKTTFIKILRERVRAGMDTMHIVPATPSTKHGWLLEAITPWLSSDSKDIASVQARMAALAETARPILICVDSGDIIREEHLADDIEAMLNLADACELKLSILICCGESRSLQIAANQTTAKRLLMMSRLPVFTEPQLVEFLEGKLRLADLSTRQLPHTKMESIARDSEGTPAIGLRLMAEALGHKVSRNLTAPKSAPAKQREDQAPRAQARAVKPKIDELLAPIKKS
jgi:hypothetical protein